VGAGRGAAGLAAGATAGLGTTGRAANRVGQPARRMVVGLRLRPPADGGGCPLGRYWLTMPQVNLAAMEAALAAFAADGGIAAAHRVVLVVDRAGWHTEQAARAAGRADALVPARLHAATEPGGAPVTAGAGGGGKLAGEQDRGTGTDRRAALCDAAWRSGAAMSGDELPLVTVVLTRTLHRESV
jgi:hypothetical protein